MLCSVKKYQRSVWGVSLFILMALFANAQNEKTDTIILKENYDSTSSSIDTTPILQTDTTEVVEKKENETEYFLKNQTESDPLHVRKLPDSIVKKMQKDNDFWYANANVKRRRNRNGEWVLTTKTDTTGKYNAVVQGEPVDREPIVLKKWFQILLWVIIIGGFATFIQVYLANSETALFRRRNKIISETESETESEDIFSINYPREIENAIRNADYRLATRLMFLRLLKQLSEKNVIQYRQDKTNLDYLMQLSPTKYYKDFFRITRNYEYGWYGLFEINADTFTVIKNDFENFSNKIV